ncbi:MAG: Lrp/AsnC family transcriptional regulator [Pedobacter sp.]|uniref:Lrp/AsnC family transcriptional regulator n=1 Tax=Pedobacter sp. TaxID=1411316 RepID=UPI003564A0B2
MPLELDKLDINILTQLQNNARISDKQISRIIHLSPNAVTTRISHLENDGYILQYTAILNKAKINKNLECFTGVNLTNNNYHNVTTFLKNIKRIPEVYNFYRINSVFDFLIHIVAVDLNDYHNLLINKLSSLHCVRDTTTFVVLNEMEGGHSLDLSHLFERFI